MAGEQKKMLDVTIRYGTQESRVRVPEGSKIAGVVTDAQVSVVFLNGNKADLETGIVENPDSPGTAEVKAAPKSHTGGR